MLLQSLRVHVAKKTGLNTSPVFPLFTFCLHAQRLTKHCLSAQLFSCTIPGGWETDTPTHQRLQLPRETGLSEQNQVAHSTVFHAGVTEKKKKRKDPCTMHTGMLLDGHRMAQQKSSACSTSYSQAVTHPSTRLAQHCLTSVIGREPVHSVWYGRRQCTSPSPTRPLLSLHLPFHTAVILQAQHPDPKQSTQKSILYGSWSQELPEAVLPWVQVSHPNNHIC